MNATRILLRQLASRSQARQLSTLCGVKVSHTTALVNPRMNFHLQESECKLCTTSTANSIGPCRCFTSSHIIRDHLDTLESPKRRLIVDYDELKTLLQTDSVLLLDVREPKELEQEGKISKAINIPLCQLKKGLQMAEELFCDTFGISKPTCKTNLVFYGRKQVKGEAASEIASKLGFKKVKHYPGGFEEWKEKEGEQKP